MTRSHDSDYAADYEEAARDRAEQVADDMREMEADDRERFDAEYREAAAYMYARGVGAGDAEMGLDRVGVMGEVERRLLRTRVVGAAALAAESAGGLTCFAFVCVLLGVPLGLEHVEWVSPADMPKEYLDIAAANKSMKVVLTVYGPKDKRNHIELTHLGVHNAVVKSTAIGEPWYKVRRVVCTSPQAVFNVGSEWYGYEYYAGSNVGDDDDQFGSLLGTRPGQSGASGSDRGARRAPGTAVMGNPRGASPARSLADHGLAAGASNVTGGVVARSTRRVVNARRATTVGGRKVQKNYFASSKVMFNNFEELVQDTISREFAQEIIEDLFAAWGIPFEEPDTVKYAEDLLWTFLIAVTASNKANYAVTVEVPHSKGTLDVGFNVLSDMLESKYGVTRRQFARGVSDDLRGFIRLEENTFLIPVLATRVGCHLQYAHLAFDGSTHCTGMTPNEVAFTKTLESRNLFERDDVLAQGASGRLLDSAAVGARGGLTLKG